MGVTLEIFVTMSKYLVMLVKNKIVVIIRLPIGSYLLTAATDATFNSRLVTNL